MSKAEKNAKKSKPSSSDKPIKTRRKGEVELTDEEMKKISGGTQVRSWSWGV